MAARRGSLRISATTPLPSPVPFAFAGGELIRAEALSAVPGSIEFASRTHR
jgi:hypothetical protein